MQCLNCHTEMTTTVRDGVEYDHCASCQATWFDHGELQGVLQGAGILFSEADLKAGIALPSTCRWCETQNPDGALHCKRCSKPLGHDCPRDGRAMLHTRFGDIEIDLCPQCSGLWFDGLEYRAMLARTGATDPQPPEDFGTGPSPCQICGKQDPAGLTWESGFLKCPTCLGPEDPEEAERLGRLKERHMRYWRGQFAKDRVATTRLGSAPDWLHFLGFWMTN